jgi:5-oxoprolinase (ATP-hydrolysing)
MGEQLRRTALSTNVKERLDFSCALLDPQGELVVNAPHIPVHLGALGLCVRQVRQTLNMAPGDVVVTNHPAHGGSHLPDVTVITPVYEPGASKLLAYVASRAHHAELGGCLPGSMPANATTLAEEGVVISPIYLVKGGRSRWQEIRRLLSTAPYPSRAVDENLADLSAQVAANRRGLVGLQALAQEHGRDTLHQFMEALASQADLRLKAGLARLEKGQRKAREELDDGSILAVRVEIDEKGMEVDFSGSSGVHPGNLNATPAVVRSALLYCLRLLVNEPLPLNEGFLRSVRLHIPEGLLNPPFPENPGEAPAVVGGNVETSQRLVDTILKALGLSACSQGTMNNVVFGAGGRSYYETVCGGAGAGPGYSGAHAVHTHMTNTRITDPEILEHRYPVRLERFAIRRGSGGRGRYSGGDGVIREIRFLAPQSLSIMSQHRRSGPYGMKGGEEGQPGRQRILLAQGESMSLEGIASVEVGPGDCLVLETPGGGGWGKPEAGRS